MNWTSLLVRAVTLVLVPGAIFLNSARAAVLGNHLDASFGGDGKITRRVTGNADGATDVATQRDGKIVAVGDVGSSSDFLVLRYNSDGTIDYTFGESGAVVTDFGGGDDDPYAIAIQPDGKIVVGGKTGIPGTPTGFGLARYNPDGSLDTGFGLGGKAYAFFADNAALYDLAIQPDGKIVAVGGAFTLGQSIFAVARYNTNGSLDTSFGNGGQVLANTNGYASAVTLQSDGKIVAVGGIGWFEMIRFNPDGTRDFPFGNGNGRVQTLIGDSSFGYGVAIQSTGKIVITGTSVLNNQAMLAVARYNTNGTLDATFDGDAIFTYRPDPTIQNQYGREVVIQSDGRIVTTGRAFFDTVVIRIRADGGLDEAFGYAGVIRTDFGSDVLDQALSIALAPNNKLVVSGRTEIGGTPGIGIARYSTSLSVPRPTADFDGDGVSELAVFRPSNGAWYIFNSYSNTFSVLSFGLAGDIPIDGDFNGDDRNDYAVFRPSNGVWYITYTSNNQFIARQFGTSGDKPVPGDYDHDGKTDAAVWRPSDGNYYVLRSSDNQWIVSHWGASGDIPIGAVTTQ